MFNWILKLNTIFEPAVVTRVRASLRVIGENVSPCGRGDLPDVRGASPPAPLAGKSLARVQPTNSLGKVRDLRRAGDGVPGVPSAGAAPPDRGAASLVAAGVGRLKLRQRAGRYTSSVVLY